MSLPGLSGGVRGPVPWDSSDSVATPPAVMQTLLPARPQSPHQPDSLAQVSFALDDQERELWRQLRRKRDFEGRIAEKSAHLAELRDRHRGISTARAEVAAAVEHLTNEVGFARQQEREIERDIAVLKESNRILQNTFQSQVSAGTLAPNNFQKEVKDFQAEDQARREAVQLQHERLAHLRAHFERMCTEKEGLQGRLQALIESHHAAEQDRNRLRGALQDGRRGLDEIGTHRLKLWEERLAMMREIAHITREANFTGSATGALAQFDHGNSRHGVMTPPGQTAIAQSPVSSLSGGVRGHVSRDTPTSFTDKPPPGMVSAGLAPEDSLRSHWTQFESGKGNRLGGCGGSNTPSFSHMDDRRNPPSFSGSNADAAMEAPHDHAPPRLHEGWESFGSGHH